MQDGQTINDNVAGDTFSIGNDSSSDSSSDNTQQAPPSDDKNVDGTSGELDINNDKDTESAKPRNDEDSAAPTGSDELDKIKNEALSKLAPVVDLLDQNPEDKYHTLMMVIQSSDDQSLIKSAYEAASKIDDEKTRAEALLNIVNEINYFSNQKKD